MLIALESCESYVVIKMSETLEQIIKKHSIDENFVNAKAMDKENRIFMSDNYVIKIYYPKKFQYYYNELEVYQRLAGKDYLPKLYQYGEEESYKYIIISKLNGQSLFDCLDNYSYEDRVSFIEQISRILRDINNIKQIPINFKPILDAKFQTAMSGVNFSNEYKFFLEGMYNYYVNYIQKQESGSLIHVDVHFYNFFVSNGKIFAYDFENTMIAPLEYQLLRWYRMWKYPETFFYPKNSLNSFQKKSYEIIMPLMLKFYPELFSCSDFEERMKLYLLVYLLEEAKRCNLSEENVNKYITENRRVRIRG